MEEWIKKNIVMCLENRIGYYVKCIDSNLAKDNKKGAMIFIKQIEEIMNFVDGIPINIKDVILKSCAEA